MFFTAFILLLAATISEARSHDASLVLFCASWIKTCKDLQSQWKNLTELYEDEFKLFDLELRFVDAETEGEYVQAKGITKYPTMVLYAPFHEVEYSNTEFTPELMGEFARNAYTNTTQEIMSFNEILDRDTQAGIFLYTGDLNASKKSKPFSIFKSVASKVKAHLGNEVTFVHLSNSTVKPTVTFILHDKLAIFDKKFTLSSLSEFIIIYNHGFMINCLNHIAIKDFLTLELTLAFGIFAGSKFIEESSFFNNFQRMAMAKRSTPLAYVYCDLEDEDALETYSELVPMTKSPAVWLVEFVDGGVKRYRVQDEVDKMVHGVRKGEIEPEFVSEEEEEAIGENQNGSQKLVAKNFKSVVSTNGSKIILVYSTDNCKKSKILIDQLILATKEADESILSKVYKIDISKNEVPDLYGYPLPAVLLFKTASEPPEILKFPHTKDNLIKAFNKYLK